MKKVKYFDTNTIGIDYIVGDLHGCYYDLMAALNAINFDKTRDRLFSVGDLIDRGPDSFKTAHLIYEPYFFSVRGNHEQLMIDAILNKDRSMAACWLNNGGVWHASYDDVELNSLARDLNELPLIICVGEGENRFNIVHAELTHRPVVNGHKTPILVTNEMIDNWTFTDDDEQDMIWGRTLLTLAKVLDTDKGKRFHAGTLSTTYVGHSQVRESVIIEKQVFIDTSAVNFHMSQNKSEKDCITLAEPNKKLLHKFSMLNRTIETIEQDTLLKYCQ